MKNRYACCEAGSVLTMLKFSLVQFWEWWERFPVRTGTGAIHSYLASMSHREAARECRRKKKEYVKCLENRVAVLENQNKTLIEELKALKDLYCHKSE